MRYKPLKQPAHSLAHNAIQWVVTGIKAVVPYRLELDHCANHPVTGQHAGVWSQPCVCLVMHPWVLYIWDSVSPFVNERLNLVVLEILHSLRKYAVTLQNDRVSIESYLPPLLSLCSTFFTLVLNSVETYRVFLRNTDAWASFSTNYIRIAGGGEPASLFFQSCPGDATV